MLERARGVAVVALALVGCGGHPPERLTYSANPATYTVGLSIAPNVPTAAGGPVLGYEVTPALPAGLSLEAATGVISGTPSVVTATHTYVVRATNADGSTTASLSLTVNDVPPAALGYTRSLAYYAVGQAIAPNLPTSSGGAVVSYSVQPALPAGLALDGTSGVISGTPSALAPCATSVVRATNSGGSTSTALEVCVVSPPPSDGLVAHYRLDGDATDASGQGNHGTATGITLAADRFGVEGHAFAFDGATSKVVVPSSASLNPGALTVSLWVKPTAIACFQQFLSKGGNGSGFTPQYAVYFCSVVRYLSSDAFQATYEFSSAHGLANGSWHHVVLTHAGTVTRLYLDGALDAEATSSPALASPTTQALLLGSEARLLAETYYRGSLDDVRVYSRALLAAEVEGLYREGGWGSR